ncbi:MAG: hypothetical protein JWN48_1549 [Myxococcaceae bacterium]|nr:hypothetical protein [Myxococcaceae bacterium]
MPSERPAAQPEVTAPLPGASARDLGASPGSERPGAEGVSNQNAGEPKSEPPPGEPKRGRFESRLPGLLRRGIEKSIEAGLYTFAKSLETGDAVRERLGDVKIPDVASAVGKALHEARLPREIAGAVLGQIDETKNDVVRIIAREVRDFLEATDLAGEIKAALTNLSFEVRTEVRFIPNDKGTGVRPDVRARGRVKRTRTTADRRRRKDAPAGDKSELDEDDEDDL